MDIGQIHSARRRIANVREQIAGPNGLLSQKLRQGARRRGFHVVKLSHALGISRVVREAPPIGVNVGGTTAFAKIRPSQGEIALDRTVEAEQLTGKRRSSSRRCRWNI